jgi:hypothetical protein
MTGLSNGAGAGEGGGPKPFAKGLLGSVAGGAAYPGNASCTSTAN